MCPPLHEACVECEFCAAINRLDRLTSGMMIIPLNAPLANVLSKEFAEGRIQKEYIARCRGEFPECALCMPYLTVH